MYIIISLDLLTLVKRSSEHLSQLKELRLESLGELVSIGLESSWTDPFVRNVETFEVIRCSSLKSLVVCKVSFSNLICLKVESCNSLSYLCTSSAARSLNQLQKLEIKDCYSIEEIVSNNNFYLLPCLKPLNQYLML